MGSPLPWHTCTDTPKPGHFSIHTWTLRAFALRYLWRILEKFLFVPSLCSLHWLVSSLLSLCVHVCDMHVCACVYTCVYGCTWMHVCVCGDQRTTLAIILQEGIHLVFWERTSCWDLGLTNEVKWLASQFQESTCLYLPNWDSKHVPLMPGFLTGTGDLTWVLVRELNWLSHFPNHISCNLQQL